MISRVVPRACSMCRAQGNAAAARWTAGASLGANKTPSLKASQSMLMNPMVYEPSVMASPMSSASARYASTLVSDL